MRGSKPNLENVIPMKGDHVRRAPPAPEHLDEHAREVWERLAPILINKGRLEPEYEDSFAAYCVMAGHVVAMSHEIAMMGSWYEAKTLERCAAEAPRAMGAVDAGGCGYEPAGGAIRTDAGR